MFQFGVQATVLSMTGISRSCSKNRERSNRDYYESDFFHDWFFSYRASVCCQ
jgi:hypothetical protein